MKIHFGKEENIGEKLQDAGLQHFVPFPLSAGLSKKWDCLVKDECFFFSFHFSVLP